MVVEDHGDHRNNLHQHFKFAQFAGLDGETFGGGNRTQSAHQKFARDNHHRHPGRNQAGVELHQGDKRGGDQKLVGQRIEQHAHGRDLAAAARQIAVDAVGDRGRDEQRRRQQFLLAVKAVKMVGGKKPDQQRDAEDAGQRDGVGQIHRGHGPPAGKEKAGSNSLSSTPQRESMKQKEGYWVSLYHCRNCHSEARPREESAVSAQKQIPHR